MADKRSYFTEEEWNKIERAAEEEPIGAQEEPTDTQKPSAAEAQGGEPTMIDDDAELTRLARLPLIEYERARTEAAKRLGCRAAMLDRIVTAKRMELGLAGRDGLPGRPVEFAEIEPWPERVDGAQLLDDLAATIGAYVIMELDQRRACALWAVFMHTHDLRDFAPLLIVMSPKRRCGKTRLLEVLARLAPRPLLVGGGVTASALANTIEEARPTLFIDEFDAVARSDKEKAEQLRGQLNSSFDRTGARQLKSVPLSGGGWVTRSFSLWAPTAIAGIGRVSDTVEDRSLIIRLVRKAVVQKTKRLRLRDGADLNILARKIARWVADNAERLSTIDPPALEVSNDRAIDAWDTLLAIADSAGGACPERARTAARALIGEDEAGALDNDVTLQLLSDIRDVFDGVIIVDDKGEPILDPNSEPMRNKEAVETSIKDDGRISTKRLLEKLHELEERPWAAFGKARKPLTDIALAGLLRPYGIRSRSMRFRDGSFVKGYSRGAFEDTFARYLAISPLSTRNSVTPLENIEENGVSQPVTKSLRDGSENGKNVNEINAVDGVTGKKGGDGADSAICVICGRPGGNLYAYGERSVWLHRECESAFREAEEARQAFRANPSQVISDTWQRLADEVGEVEQFGLDGRPIIKVKAKALRDDLVERGFLEMDGTSLKPGSLARFQEGKARLDVEGRLTEKNGWIWMRSTPESEGEADNGEAVR